MSDVKQVETFDEWVEWLKCIAAKHLVWEPSILVKCTEIELVLSLGDTSKKSRIYVWVMEMRDYPELYEPMGNLWQTAYTNNYWLEFAMDFIRQEIKA